MTDLQEQSAERGAEMYRRDLREQGASSYSSEIRNITRSLWNGAMSYEQAFDLMMFNIRAGLTSAWHSGMKEVGLQPSDMTPEEQLQLQQVIFSEFSHIDGFLTAIETQSKADGGKLGPLLNRAQLWINRYQDVQNQAKQMAQNDPILQWVYGDTEHCGDCLKLNDKKKRASTWRRYGIRPQSPDLECHGYNCQCQLVLAEGPLSKGPLPRLSGG